METIILYAFTLFYGIFGLRNPPLPNQWLLVLKQDTTADDGYFDYNIGLTGIQNKENPQSNTFSIVGGLDKNDFLYNDAYQFRLVYEGLSDGSTFDETWTQTSWLMDAIITGSSLGEYDENNPDDFYGLGLSHRAFLDGNAADHPNYWYAVGAIQPLEGGIPAIHGLVAKSVRLMVCAGEDCDGGSETFECPLDDDNAVACPVPYNYPSCAPDCVDEEKLNGPGLYRMQTTKQCYKTWDDCRNCIDQVDRRDIVDCETGNPIEGFGFKTCSKETDAHADTDADFTIIYQVGMQRYSCDIIGQPRAANALYTCKSAIPIGECFEEEDDFVQINIVGSRARDDVCVDAIIFDGKMLPTEPIRIGDDVHKSPFFVDSSGVGNDHSLPFILNPSAPKLNWIDAEQYCQDTYGTSLVSIHSAEEMDLIRQSMSQFDSDEWCWIGLNDRENEGQWVWSDMSPVDYTHWEQGEPNDLNGEDCAELYSHKFRDSRWNDGQCSNEYRPLCTRPIIQEVFKRRYNVRDGNVLRMSLPTGYESLELIAPQCFTMRVEVTACEWHDEAVGGDLMMRISGSEGKGNYFSVNEAAQLPISGETKEYFFTSSVYDGIGKLDGIDLHVEDDDGYCISNAEVDTLGYWAVHGGIHWQNGRDNLDHECKLPTLTEHDQSGKYHWVTGNMGYQCCSLDGSDDANRHGCTEGEAYTYDEAAANCAADNKRLCTMEEVEKRKGASTGCAFDSTLVWTATGCMQSMDFDANHFGNGIFLQPESLELQHNSRRRMLESEGEEAEPNSLRFVTIGSLMVVVLCMMVILYYARVTSADKKMKLLDDGNSIQLQV